MLDAPAKNPWNERYAAEGYLFGEEPNAFLQRQAHRFVPGQRVLAVADGEGRNGVWLAQQGLNVVSLDNSDVGQNKARKLAATRGVRIEFVLADVTKWFFPATSFDIVVGIFIQFADPNLRTVLFESMKHALKPGGLLLVEGYRPEQLAYRTGGPPIAENLYTEPMLRDLIKDCELLELSSYVAVIKEGTGHSGMSALIDLVGKPD